MSGRFERELIWKRTYLEMRVKILKRTDIACENKKWRLSFVYTLKAKKLQLIATSCANQNLLTNTSWAWASIALNSTLPILLLQNGKTLSSVENTRKSPWLFMTSNFCFDRSHEKSWWLWPLKSWEWLMSAHAEHSWLLMSAYERSWAQ